MAKRVTGRYERSNHGGEQVSAFVPNQLPPKAPPLNINQKLTHRLQMAENALARLELSGQMIPSLNWFLYAFVRKEAVLSSQIEGTQATLVDLMEYETEEKSATKNADLLDVCNYLEAIKYARSQLIHPKGLPISMRLLNETHKRLMRGVRGKDKQPGHVRQTQNWIGGSRPGNAAYVPPPPHTLAQLLGEFEKYIHAKSDLHPLIKAGLLHVQFETIHPYLDGNGRVGRMLVSLLLEHWKLLSQPLLYLSLFLKQHRAEYYRLLDNVRTDGDWESWLDFFLDGVATVAEEAVKSAQKIFALVEKDRSHVLAQDTSSLAALRLFELLPRYPIVTVASVIRLVETTKPTAGKAIASLIDAGILKETTGKKRDRTYAYNEYLEILKVGTEMNKAG